MRSDEDKTTEGLRLEKIMTHVNIYNVMGKKYSVLKLMEILTILETCTHCLSMYWALTKATGS